MATTIESLPYDILETIAEMCTWEVEPLKDRPPTYARNHAALARSSVGLYRMLNRPLYYRNLHKDPPAESCLLWAARTGSLTTIKRAIGYGADPNSMGASRGLKDYELPWELLSGHAEYFATPLHLALYHDHPDIVFYLLSQCGVNVHALSRNFCGCDDKPLSGRTYPLHIAIAHSRDAQCNDYAALLVQHGATMVAPDMPAVPDLASAGRLDLVRTLLDREDQPFIFLPFTVSDYSDLIE